MTEKQLPEHYKRLMKLIKEGADKATPTKELAQTLNVDIRTIRTWVSDLNTNYGVLIGGIRVDKRNGLFYPVNETERLMALAPIQRQISKESKRVDALMFGQFFQHRHYLEG